MFYWIIVLKNFVKITGNLTTFLQNTSVQLLLLVKLHDFTVSFYNVQRSIRLRLLKFHKRFYFVLIKELEEDLRMLFERLRDVAFDGFSFPILSKLVKVIGDSDGT